MNDCKQRTPCTDEYNAAGCTIHIMDVDPVYDNFSVTPNGIRDFLATRARGLGLTGLLRRMRSHHLEIQIEGGEQEIILFSQVLQGLIRDEIVGSVTFVLYIHIPSRVYPDVTISKNLSSTCRKGSRSPDGFETSSLS